MQYTSQYHSPLGEISIAADEIGLTGLWFEGQKYYALYLDKENQEQETQILKDTKRWLDIYFSGKEPDFIPKYKIENLTPFRSQVIDIMNNITPHDLKDGTNNYGLEDIIAENHNRVMTKDHYRLHSDLDAAYDREIKLLDEYFSKFKPDDYKDEWQQKIIKYIYKRLTQSVRQDRGLGVGTHPWEEHPARTMLVEESILADKILVGINPEEKWMMNEPYKKAFKDNNITSSTWNYVGCVNDIDAIIKLEIIKNHLSQIEVYTRQDLVLCRYIGGLRQIAQYKILKLMGKEDTVAMDILREMPFCNSSESSAQDS